MKRRRVTSRKAGGALEASPGIIYDYTYNNDHATTVAANLPKIPGLSMRYALSFLHVLQVTSKFYQTDLTMQPFTIVDWERLNNRSIDDYSIGGNSSSIGSDTWNTADEIISKKNVNKTVHDTIMNRIEATSNKSTSTASANYDNRQRKFVEAVNTWVSDVQFLARRRKRQQSMNGDSAITTEMSATTMNLEKHQPPENPDASQPIPYSMFLYLWKMQQLHKTATVRRSALFLSGLLLLRSKDCRLHLDQETYLADWVSNMCVKIRDHDSSDASLRTNSDRKIIQLALLEREASCLISHLVDKGFGRIYAKLAVAAKSLRHRCTTSLLETSDLTISTITPAGMANWRRLRDFALLHGHKEIQKVKKLLDQADECLEILVPRIEGVRRPSPLTCRKGLSVSEKNDRSKSCQEGKEILGDELSNRCSIGNINVNKDSSESDEDGIDWEDGHEIENNIAKSANNEQDLHLSAVEMTMVAMERTAGNTLFSGGKLEINFDRRMDAEYGNDGVRICSDDLASNEKKARQKLEKIVRKLSDRHLVRLSAWLGGLRNSDNLRIESASPSLVSLSPGNKDLRLELVNSLSGLRQDASRVISSTSRLNIQVHQGMNKARARSAQTIGQNPNEKPVSSIEGTQSVTVRAEMAEKRISKKINKQRRFRRIQIKYRKESR